MPVEYKRDPRTGKVVRVGSIGAGQGFVPAAPPKPRPAAKAGAKPAAKPWWGQYLDKLSNDVRFELNQLRTDPMRSLRRAAADINRTNQQREMSITLGTFGAVANAGRNAVEAHQRLVQGKPKADYTQSPVGRFIDTAEDTAYRAVGQTPPSQMTAPQKALADSRSSVALGFLSAAAGGAALQGLKGVAFVGPKAAALEQFLDPTKAKTFVGGATRLLMGAAADEALTTPLDDNTGSSAVGFANAVLGTSIPDPVKPGMDRIEAAGAAFVPNTVFSFGLAGGLAGGLGAVSRARRGARTIEEQATRRKKLEDGGIIQSNPETGATAFTPEAVQPPTADVSFRQAEADFLKTAGMPPREAAQEPAAAPQPIPSQEMAPGGAVMDPGAALPSDPADKTQDVWDADYDPALPEADVGLAVLEQLDDEELPIAAQADNPIQTANDLIQQRPPMEVTPTARVDLTAAPSSSLADPVVPFQSQWEALPTAQLKSLAAPENSPELFSRIQDLTGRDWEEFSKADVVDGLNLLKNEGVTVIPNRLLPGQQITPTSEIAVDPTRFQFKQGVDAQGQQKGNSLSGVDRWNSDAEGSIQVWSDPMDGKTYVVNGHNRLAKAKELGIPSMRTEELLAATPEQARATGAIANISSGGGTVFDAAKFLRDGGITDPAQLEQLGIPLNSGFGGQGLALSRLPQNIFQAAVDGEIPLGKAVALGGSALDEGGMQAAWKMLQGRDMTDATFSEVVQMGQSARTVEGDQVDLFGNTEQLNTMVQKAELAAKVRADLIGDKNLFGRVGRNAGKLEAGGNTIDAAGSQDVAARAQALIGQFDAEKYAEGTAISELLNEGAAQLAQGGKAAVIARRIKQQLAAEAAAAPAPELPRVEAPVEVPVAPRAMTPDERTALQLAAIQKAAASGEVRPPSTPIPEIPRDSGVSIQKAAKDLEAGQITDDVAQLLDDELRLRREHEELDAAMKRAQVQEVRDAIGYDELTFEEKKALGMAEGFVAPAAPTITPGFTAGDRAKAKAGGSAYSLEQLQARLAAAQDPVTAAQIQRKIDELGQPSAAPIDIPPAASRKITAKTSESRVRGAAESLMSWINSGVPGERQLVTRLEQALDIVRAKGAILDPDAIPGLSVDAARNEKAMGKATASTEAVGQAYKQFYGVGQSGGLRATMQPSASRPGAGIPSRLVDEWLFEKPDGWAATAARQLMSTKKPKDFTKREAFLVDFAAEVRDFGGEQRFRQAWLDMVENNVAKGADASRADELEGWIATYAERAAQSLARSATSELMQALKEGARVSGINPERMKVLNEIAIADQFGLDQSYLTAKAWDPVNARLLDQRPFTDAARYMDSRTAGLRVPVQFPGPLQDSILLSLELQLSKAFGQGRAASGRRGRSMVGDAYHESFHRLQEFLFPTEKAALETPEAKGEMVALIKKGGGTYQPDMDIMEIQAEAFAVWALRRYEVRSKGSAVQAIFSAISELVNNVGAVVRAVRQKTPTLIDVFEDAWNGGIGDRSDKVLQKLGNPDLLRVAGDVDAQLAKIRPDLAQRVQAEIDRRYAQVEGALDDWNNRNREEGC